MNDYTIWFEDEDYLTWVDIECDLLERVSDKEVNADGVVIRFESKMKEILGEDGYAI